MHQLDKQNSWLGRLKVRLAKTGDSEPEQAIKIRLTIGLGIIFYFCLPWGNEKGFLDTLFSLPSLTTLFYYCLALSIVLAIIINPKPSPARRIFGMVIDLGALSILMFFAG
ncbi:MAG TPA: hybrid sensor histidine kinase/response regulator, partial [Methylophaga sp.]|nr:hybrid sensor histidine kinase/response regulator [Methylophaga sp.]